MRSASTSPASSVNMTIHAGEPGASLPTTRKRIEDAWGARCFDHVGATEVGAWGFECQQQSGIHINEGEFIAEVIDPATLEPATEGELVITNLGRQGMPVVRYRTGDRVRWDPTPCDCGRTFARLDGGVVGRVDDVMIIRGVNIFPSAIENIVRGVPGDRRVRRRRVSAPGAGRHGDPDRGRSRATRRRRWSRCRGRSATPSGLRAAVNAEPFGSLPRFDLKARRVTDHRPKR